MSGDKYEKKKVDLEISPQSDPEKSANDKEKMQ
jgi:hypothetical protein